MTDRDLRREAMTIVRNSVGGFLHELASVIEAASTGTMRVNTTPEERKTVADLVERSRAQLSHPAVNLVSGRVRLASDTEILDAAVALREFMAHCVDAGDSVRVPGQEDAIEQAVERFAADPAAELADRLIEEHAAR